jgi:pyruvate/2-oxoglutarate dehydrogenase complex dihydrolipoamide dehydrogenase (E3) component
MATTWPDKRIDLYFPGDRALGEYHPRIWNRVHRRLTQLGVGVHPGHRAVVPAGFLGEEVTGEPVRWATGQSPARAGAVLWAIGRVQPNTDWLPRELLDERGFVRVTPELRVPGYAGVFAVGDVAATDPLRSSARTVGTRSLPETSAPNPPVDGCAPTGRPRAGGARCWAFSPRGWKSSCPRATHSVSRHGRWNG